jgi:hypothetical protein
MNKPIDDFDDMPELTDEMLNEFQQLKNVDLHLGVPEVKMVDKDWWMKQYGPKPLGPEIYALDALIVLLALIVIDLCIMSWIHVFS